MCGKMFEDCCRILRGFGELHLQLDADRRRRRQEVYIELSSRVQARCREARDKATVKGKVRSSNDGTPAKQCDTRRRVRARLEFASRKKIVTSNENRRVGNFRDGVSSATPDLLFQTDGANKPSIRLELSDGALTS